ncbi:MAG: PIG-L family deacetylase [Candidatus Heimdallarchaeota archaeon]|nr:PIG-L family deacetylase [Candidatus Heimdallarchaeota archaeon]
MKVLVLSPHTDDVELGAGGTISKLMEQGWDTYWMVFSTAEKSLPPDMDKLTLRNEFLDVIGYLENKFILTIKKEIFSYEVRRLPDHRQEILDHLVKVRNNYKPDLVIGPSIHDFHQDHQVVANEMIRAFKTHASIICYELPWNHIEFNTQLFVELSEDHISSKVEILQFYKSQMEMYRQYFSEEYARGLASVRGTQIRSRYAEAFEVVRWQM